MYGIPSHTNMTVVAFSGRDMSVAYNA